MPANTSHKQAVTSRLIRTKLLVHFLLFSIAPIAISVLWLIYNPVPRFADILILVLMWCWVGGVGISLGMHRYFSHGSFEPSRPFEWAMAIAGAMAAQGPISYWVAVHRCHHQLSDTPGDPHSPNLAKSSGLSGRIRSFFHGHVGWVVNHEIPKTKYFGADLRRNKIVRSVDRHYHTWAVLGILIPGCILGLIEGSVHGFISGCVYGGFLRILIVNHVTWSVNSVCHSLGSQPFDTHDHSRNNLIVALFSFGEGWHNNHHAFPWSAKFGLRWWQFDPGWLTLNALSIVRAVRRMKQPTSRQEQQAAPHQSSDLGDTTLATITRQTTTTDPALEAKLVRRRDDQQRAIRQGDRSRKHDQSNSLS